MAATSVKTLREKLREPANAIQRLRDQLHAANEGKPTEEWRDFTPEEKAQWDKANADYNAISRQVEIAEAAEMVQARGEALVGDLTVGRGPLTRRGGDGAAASDETRTLALAAWFRSQMGADLTDEQTEACNQAGVNPRSHTLDVSLYPTQQLNILQRRFRSVHPSRAVDHCLDFRADLSTGSGAAGGYLIAPATMASALEINMLAFGGMRQVAETIRTASGEPFRWPTADDTSNTGAQLGENTSIGSSTDPSWGAKVWSAYKFSSKPILVPYELLQDSLFNLPGILGQMMGERLGRITNAKFTTGAGGSTPTGLTVAAATGKTAASATAIAADELIDLIHSVDPAYRNGAGFMCHDNIIAALRKLKTGDGQYLWMPGIQSNVPDQLFGYPYTINQDMASSIAASAKTVAFGQLSRYKIRSVGAVRMYRLEERYRDTDQDGFIAFVREDGNLLNAGTNPVKLLVQAAS